MDDFVILTGSPAHIERIKSLVLTLAFRGRLVSQDERETDASILLKRIHELKKQLKEEKKARRQNYNSPIKEQDHPYSLPDKWKWVRLDQVSIIMMGQSPKGSSYNAEGIGIPLINGPVEFGDGPFEKTIKSKWTTEPTKLCQEGDLLVCVRGATTGRTNIAAFDACIGRGVAAIRPLGIFDEYLHYFMLYSRYKILSLGTGTTFPSISQNDLRNFLFPLPPLPEQRRIVQKVNHLFRQIDALAAGAEQAEGVRRRLRAALLHRLEQAPEWAAASRAWAQLEEQFGLAIRRVEDVQALRQSILQLAVKGLLVEQDPVDEPASVLLERIKEEKARLVEEGKIRKQKKLPAISKEEKPFEVPEGWRWCRLGDISSVVRGGSPRPAKDPRYYGGDIPFLKVADLTAEDKMYLERYTYTIKEAGLKKTRFVEANTLMLTNSGATLGVPKICNFSTTFNDGIAAFLGLSDKTICKEYLYYFLKSLTKWFLDIASRGQGQPNLNTDIIKETLLPLPPLAEQRRIVERVEGLLGWCDRLEAAMREMEEKEGRLVRAALKC